MYVDLDNIYLYLYRYYSYVMWMWLSITLTENRNDLQAYEYLVKECKVSYKNIVVMGDSAGGGLSLSLLLRLVDEFYETG